MYRAVELVAQKINDQSRSLASKLEIVFDLALERVACVVSSDFLLYQTHSSNLIPKGHKQNRSHYSEHDKCVDTK